MNEFRNIFPIKEMANWGDDILANWINAKYYADCKQHQKMPVEHTKIPNLLPRSRRFYYTQQL